MTPDSLAQKYSLEFQFTGNSIWVSTDVSVEEALECFKTGLLRNQPVQRVKLFSVGEDDTVHFIYDIVAAKTGAQPWGLV